MTATLHVKLFGIPTVKREDDVITFPYAKVDALLYYLLLNQTVSRSEIASMLWPNKDDAKAKKNLRNSIYQANKTLGAEYILTPGRYTLKLNPDLPLDVDVWTFTKAPATHCALYQGELLKGFFLKDADDYESWLLDMRAYYETLYKQQLRQQIELHMTTMPDPTVEQQIQALIALDDYNEENYRLLMTYYQQVGLNSKVIETYYAVTDLFKRDLNILPSAALTAIYKETIHNLQTDKVPATLPKPFYVRSQAIAQFEQTMATFRTENRSQRLLVIGESGSGKTTFIQQMLATVDSDCRLIYLYATDYLPSLAGQIWQQFITRLLSSRAGHLKQTQKVRWRQQLTTDLEQWLTDSTLREERFATLRTCYLALYGERPLFFVLEHLEQADSLSLDLLNALALSDQLPFLFILSGNQSWTHLKAFTIPSHPKTITLQPLNDYWSNEHLNELLGPAATSLPHAMRQDILTYAQGNLLVLQTLSQQYQKQGTLDLLAKPITAMIEEQCHFFSATANTMLEVMSFFKEGVTLAMLVTLMKQPAETISAEVDNLYQQQVITEETVADTLMIRISQRRVRHYFYLRQPESIRRLMHHTIADTLAQSIDNNAEHLGLLKIIAYHYDQAKQTVQALDYELAYLQNILRFEHELFPVYQQTKLNPAALITRYTDHDIATKFQEIEARLQQLPHQEVSDQHYSELVIKFRYIEGRYYIRNGQYEVGLANIAQVIAQAKGIGKQDYLLRGYLQMIYYYIQVESSLPMKRYVDLALELAVESNNYQYTAIVLRLRGLQFLMTGQLSAAEQALNASIKMLTLTDYVKRHFMVSLAAAYDYLAEVAFIRGQYQTAYETEQLALDYLSQQQAESSRIVLETNMGGSSLPARNTQLPTPTSKQPKHALTIRPLSGNVRSSSLIWL